MYLQLYHDCLNLPYYITFNLAGKKKNHKNNFVPEHIYIMYWGFRLSLS